MENNMQPENMNTEPVNENNTITTNNESVVPQVNSASPVESVQQPYVAPVNNTVAPVESVQQPYVAPANNTVAPVESVQQPYSAPVNNNTQPNNNYQQPYYNGQAQYNGQQPAAPGLVPVNKIGYVLLAFFIGAFGAHKFYAGKTTQGILYLVFFWTVIPSILALIDFIIGLTKPADANGNILV